MSPVIDENGNAYYIDPNGNKKFVILNVANVKSCETLEADAVALAEKLGFVLCDTLYLVLSSIAGKGIKREPVFIFKKQQSK